VLVPKVRILITSTEGVEYNFNYCVDGEIERNFEKLTQTAKFTIPNTYGVNNIENSLRSDNIKITDKIKKGSKVSIFLRFLYNDFEDKIKRSINPEVERFTGYISKVKPGYLASFECEDEMWKLKQTVFQGMAFPSSATVTGAITLKKLIDYLKSKTGFTFDTNIADASDLGIIQVSPGNTFADVLDFIRNKYLILCYFKKGTLIMLKGNQFVNNITKTFTFNGSDANITDKGSLEWQYIDDIKLMIKYTCQVPMSGKADKKTTRYIYYDVSKTIRMSPTPPQGYNQIEHITTNDLTEFDILKNATQLLETVTYTGYKGEFSTFGEPVMDFGDRVSIINQRYPELNSKELLIRAVKTTFGNKGYFQHLNIYGQ
jgi:hypothetical protein